MLLLLVWAGAARVCPWKVTSKAVQSSPGRKTFPLQNTEPQVVTFDQFLPSSTSIITKAIFLRGIKGKAPA